MLQPQRWTQAVIAFAVAMMLCAPMVRAEGQGSALSVSGGFDFVDKYFFRGIIVQNQGLMVQPYLDVNVDLGGVQEGLSMVVGTWHHVSESNTPANIGSSAHQEFDWYVGLSMPLADNVEGSLTYTEYSVPAGGATVDEISFGVSLDDSEAFGGMGLSPYLLIAVELNGGADGGFATGGESGIYLEIGIEPTFELVQSETNPIDLAIPIVVGLSLDDYFETTAPTTPGNATPDDETLGFISVSLVCSTPFHWIPEEYGAWTLSAGVEFLFLGDNNEDMNGGEDSEINVSIGLSFEQ